jgi:RsiW-degrading membrane proteinase PrsW (M82 family)/DNA-directed RNA polymerase subunit RPC12/RpoP
MAISLVCPGCGKRLKAKETLAGRTVPCPGCGHKLLIPAAEEAAADILLQDESPPEPADDESPEDEAPPPERRDPEPRRPLPSRPMATPRRQPTPTTLPPLKSDETPAWLRHLHWLLALALIPLGITLLQSAKDDMDWKKRLVQTLKEASPEAQEHAIRALDRLGKKEEQEKTEATIQEILACLPEGKFAGALLSHDTWAHWGFALAAAGLFLGFLLFLAADGSAEARHLLLIGIFTATGGILILLLFQVLASWSQGVWLRGGGVITILFYIVKLIGFSYRAAMEHDNGFFLSFLGFTLGVGFCEEVCKALPLLWHYRQPSGQRWRTAFLWGLASGAGFGIAEGVMYSRDFYNGIGGADVYLVRFLSCVALHAVWTGAVAVTLHQNQALIQKEMSWYEFIPPLVFIVGIPMVLHGLYDTLLKQRMEGAALVVAVASFLYLAFRIRRLGNADDAAARDKLLREYQRRRAAIS